MNLRKITSLTMMLSFILLVITSILLYIVPQGRIAYWADWHFWGMTKTQWANLHINLGFLFLLAGFLHLFYNWKPMLAYMKNRSRQVKVFTPSFIVAMALCLVVGVGTLLEVPPLSTVISFGDSIKDKAAVKYGEPPYGHAELSSLKLFAKQTNLDPDKAMELLKKAGIKFDDEKQTIVDISKANKIAPKTLADIMKSAKIVVAGGTPFPETAPTGFGRKTLASVCTEYSLNMKAIVRELDRQGIRADRDGTIKDIAADNNGMDPHALFEILHGIVGQQPAPAPMPAPAKATAPNKTGVEVNFPETPPTGFGRKTLNDICAEYGLNSQSIVSELEKKDIRADPESAIKEIAANNNMDPHGLFEVLRGVVQK